MWQLPPIYDNIIMDNNHLDGRPDFSPSHWKENFQVFYLTEKMRSHSDLEFSSLCDRVGRNRITEEDEIFLKSTWYPWARVFKARFFDRNEFPAGVRFCEDMMCIYKIYNESENILVGSV